MLVKMVLLASLAAGVIQAQFLHIEVLIRDMNCEPCSQTLETSLQKMRGVDRVKVDFKTATAAVDLAVQNRIGVDQVWDAIKRVGFTPGETLVKVRGAVKASKIEVAGINKTFEIEGRASEGDSVELTGTITPPPDPRTPVRIQIKN
jgi:copper chaperone CopZ